MLPAKNQEERAKLQDRLADEIRLRCSAEISAAYKLYNGDTTAIKRHLSYTIDGVVSCCQGDHSNCKRHSLLCKGVETEDRVWKFTFLKRNTKLICTRDDVKKLRECVIFRLSEDTIDET